MDAKQQSDKKGKAYRVPEPDEKKRAIPFLEKKHGKKDEKRMVAPLEIL